MKNDLNKKKGKNKVKVKNKQKFNRDFDKGIYTDKT